MLASPSVRALSVVSLVGALAFQPAVRAIPIGDFSWNEHTEEECDAGLCGAFFAVGNFSDLTLDVLGGSFFDVFVDLETADSPSLSLGEIGAGASSQSIDDLFGLVIASAALRLTFAIPTLPGTVQLLDLDGNVVAGLTGPGSLLIDYAVDEVVTVPEPSTPFLLLAGLAAIALVRKAREGTLQTSRMRRSRHVFAT